MTDAIEARRIAGMSVLVMRGADTLLVRRYGTADVELNAPTPEGAVYGAASLTKQFTAAAILQLAQAGTLSLDDDITRWLPDYPSQGRRVSLRRLLDHTSGIHGMHSADPELAAIRTQALPADTLVRLYGTKPFQFEPGDGMLYNNTGYYLLGMIVERASGMPWEAYLQRNLLGPAGMTDTRVCSDSTVIPRRVQGYSVDVAEARAGRFPLRPAPYVDWRWGLGSGSLCSTTGDLAAWTRALHGGRILSADAYRTMTTPEPLNDGTVPAYGKGLTLLPIAGHRAVYHTGASPGFSSALAYLPDDSLTVVVLMNSIGAVSPTGIAEFLVRVVLGDRTPPAVPFTGSAADYTGTYPGAGSTRAIAVTVDVDTAGRLTARPRDGSPAPLTYLGGESFARGGTRYTFVREGGRVARMRVENGNIVGYAARQAPALAEATP